jgi:hypothetical protein
MTEFDSNEFRLFKAELARLNEPGIAVPPELDEVILSGAKNAFNSRRRKWMIIQRIGAGLAAAAVLAIAVHIFLPSPHSTGPIERPQLAQVADINHDGRVDILDAYVVARHIAQHDSLDKAWDINGDGIVDQKDVDLIATLAVHVSGEKPQ